MEFDENTTFNLPRVDIIVWCSGFDVASFNTWLDLDRVLPTFKKKDLVTRKNDSENIVEKTFFAPPAFKANPRTWFKKCFPPSHGRCLGFFGWVRPQQGGLPQCAELLARYHALLLSGDRRLPEDLAFRARREGQIEAVYYNHSGPTTLGDYPSFCDAVATLIDCKPEPNVLLEPLTCIKYWLYPTWGFWYRARGPGAKPEVLHDVLKRFPLRKTIRSSKGTGNAAFFGMHTLAILGIVFALLQRFFTLLILLFPSDVFRKPGMTPYWVWLKPKHFLLHGNELNWKTGLLAS